MSSLFCSRAARAAFLPLAPLALGAHLVACGSPPASSTAHAPPTSRASASAPAASASLAPRESPPPIGALPPFSLPRVTRESLVDGIRFALVTRPSAPLIETHFVVRDATQLVDVGTAHVLAAYLDETIGKSATQLEATGSRLSIELHGESIEITLTAPKKAFRDALLLALPLAASPKWDAAVFARVKSRASDAARARAKTHGQSSVGTAALRELGFVGRRPSAAEVNAVTLEKAKELHQKAFVQKNVSAVVVGDIELDETKAALMRPSSSFSSRPAPTRSARAATLPTETRVLVIDRPKSAQSSVLIAFGAPAMNKESGTSAELLVSCLGDSNALSNRLFSDVREKRGLAYVLGSDILALGSDSRPWFTYAATQTAKTGETVAALIETIRGLPSLRADEVDSAKRLATANLAAKMETARGLADLIVLSERFALAENHWDELSATIARATVPSLLETLRAIDTTHPLIVVNGDADSIVPMLRSFGPISILDPLDFHLVRTESKASP